MSANGIAQIVFYLVVLTALTPPLGAFIARVYEGKRVPGLTRVFGPVERGIYRLLRIDPAREQNWKSYASSVVVFGAVGFALLYLILRLQGHLPMNPADLPGMSWSLAFNTAVSFVTNTNWQFYGGESTLSYLSQMLGLTVQNFVSAAVGMAVLAAVIRGFTRRGTASLGNFWSDLVRVTLYVLVPLAVVWTLILGSQGVMQTFSDPVTYQTVEARTLGATGEDNQPVTQTVVRGPVASQIAIKQLGTNGGGYYNTNSATPFENPTPLSNFFEMLGDPPHSRGTDLHVRQDGGLRRAGLGAVRGHDGDPRGRHLRGAALRAARVPGAAPDGCRALRHVELVGRQPPGQGGPLRRRQLGAVG